MPVGSETYPGVFFPLGDEAGGQEADGLTQPQ